MQRIIGDTVTVCLGVKGSGELINIGGVLKNVTADSVYVHDDGEIFVIPRDNVVYYVVRESRNNVATVPCHVPQQKAPRPPNNLLNVYINKQNVVTIPLPPGFPLDQWNDQIYTLALENQEVRAMLVGRTQKSIEYSPGEVYIEVEEELQVTPNNNDSFSMGAAGSPTSQFLKPSQMVSRLQNSVSREER